MEEDRLLCEFYLCRKERGSSRVRIYILGLENGIVVYVYSKNAGGILVSDSLRVDDNWVFERKNGSFCIDKQQFPMEETIENNLGSNADIFI